MNRKNEFTNLVLPSHDINYVKYLYYYLDIQYI